MRFLLYEGRPRAHLPIYLQRLTEALSPIGEVTIAAPDDVLTKLGESTAVAMVLRDATHSRRAERTMFEQTVAEASPDHVIHLYGDDAFRWLTNVEPGLANLSVIAFRLRSHYRRCFGSKHTLRETIRASMHAALASRFLRRSDAYALFTLDPYAAAYWRRRTTKAFWLPEPFARATTVGAPAGDGALVFYGSIAPRKGLARFVAAVECMDRPRPAVSLVGPVAPGYEGAVRRLVSQLREAGAAVTTSFRWYSEDEIYALLSSASCVVAPYTRHVGMSRVLVEAASAGVPIVADEYGLLGHWVRERHLGVAVDSSDARAFAEALAQILSWEDRSVLKQHLRSFARAFSPETFAAAVRAPFETQAGAS